VRDSFVVVLPADSLGPITTEAGMAAALASANCAC